MYQQAMRTSRASTSIRSKRSITSIYLGAYLLVTLAPIVLSTNMFGTESIETTEDSALSLNETTTWGTRDAEEAIDANTTILLNTNETSIEMETEAPVATPAFPVAATSSPTVMVTSSPTITATDPPSVATDSPTGSPTASPIDTPSAIPTAIPTASLTANPSASPTAIPTASPTARPTASPTVRPTARPTTKPTKAPVTPRPTRQPNPEPTTQDPTPPPTSRPTASPTIAPTAAPTKAPVPATNSPIAPFSTAAPVEAVPDTDAPTILPVQTSSPVEEERTSPATVKDLTVVLSGVPSLTSSDIDHFESSTSNYLITYWEGKLRGLIVTTKFIEQSSASALQQAERSGGNNLRRLQYDVQITYTQTISYISSTDLDITAENVALEPFDTNFKRRSFLVLLNDDYPRFDNVKTVSQVKIAALLEDPETEPEGGNEGINMYIIIGAAAGGVLLIGLLAGAVFMKRRSKKSVKKLEDSGIDIPSHRESNVQDDSTLADPAPRLGVISSNESLAGYGDQSVSTMDYDYSRAFGGDGEHSVSDAGGTFGDTIAGGTIGSATIGGNTIGGGSVAQGTLAENTIFSDDSSFENHYRGGASPIREELIDVIAPPGKLGVVIDTPDDGAPVVHAIKDSSCVADKLKVGDKLVAVDGEDVRAMTAIKVSKMISRKSANPQRKLTVVRSFVE